MQTITQLKKAISGDDIEISLNRYNEFGQVCFAVDIRIKNKFENKYCFDSYITALDKYYDLITQGVTGYGLKFERVVLI